MTLRVQVVHKTEESKVGERNRNGILFSTKAVVLSLMAAVSARRFNCASATSALLSELAEELAAADAVWRAHQFPLSSLVQAAVRRGRKEYNAS